MKYKTAIIILIFTCTSYAQQLNCLDFKTGTFEYADKNMPDKIVRTDSLQVETNHIDGIEIYTSIKWTSDCKYVLTYEKILNYSKDSSKIIGQKIYVEIIEINGNRIKVHAKGDYIDNVIEFIKTGS